MTMGNTCDKPKGCWRNIHFAITNQNVAIAAKATHTLIFMDIGMIRIQKIAMTNNKIKQRVRIAVGVHGIATKDIENGAPIVLPRRNLTIGVIRSLSPRIGQPLNLITFRIGNQAKIRITIATTAFIMEAGFCETFLDLWFPVNFCA